MFSYLTTILISKIIHIGASVALECHNPTTASYTDSGSCATVRKKYEILVENGPSLLPSEFLYCRHQGIWRHQEPL